MSKFKVVRVISVSESKNWYTCEDVESKSKFRLKSSGLKSSLLNMIDRNLGGYILVVKEINSDTVKISSRTQCRAIYNSLNQLNKIVEFAKKVLSPENSARVKQISYSCAGIQRYNQLIQPEIKQKLELKATEVNSNSILKKYIFYKTYSSTGYHSVIDFLTSLMRDYTVRVVYVGNSTFRISFFAVDLIQITRLVSGVPVTKAEILFSD
jgi:hypothetical protein